MDSSVRNKLIFFVLGWLGMVLYFAQRWIFGPIIPALMKEFQITKTAVGTIGSASIMGYMLSPILAGWLSDRFGRKKAILFGLSGLSSLTIFCGLAQSSNQLFVARFFTGVTEPFFFIPMLAFTLELFTERPGFFLTLMSSGSSLGWFVGPALAGWLLNTTGNWRSPFWAAGVTGLVLSGLLVQFWPRMETTIPSGSYFKKGLFKSGRVPVLIFLGFVAAFQISAEFGFTMWFPAFLELELKMTTAAAGMMAGLYGLGQFVGRPVLGWISDKKGYHQVGTVSGLILTLFLILALEIRQPTLQGLAILLGGFIGSGVMGALWTSTGLIFADSKGLALGLITTAGYALATLAPVLIGYIADQRSVGLGLWLVCIPAAFLAALAFLIIRFISKRPDPERLK
ncbi:MAG TPA: MFS transporter [Thermodesulfobacteriota bacterium]|nr:MFS transporter [Thermodesulfobacteriota bacterium]